MTLFAGAIMLAVALIFGIRNITTAQEGKDWPQTEGQIASGEIRYHRRRSWPDGYSPRVTYRYSVDGQAYVGRRIWLVAEEEWSSRDGAAAVLDQQFPVGRTVTVYYDPARPERSALLLQGPTLLIWIAIGALGLFLVVGGSLARVDPPSSAGE